MTDLSEERMEDTIIAKAMSLGAHKAGIADVSALRNAPSYRAIGKLEHYSGVGSRPGEAVDNSWPDTVRSVLVLAVAHPEDHPELDWWGDPKGTEGNRILFQIADDLVDWLREHFTISARNLPYYVEKGGVFLKDAAVLAGLGCIGKSNLLVTPEYGPRVRLRALFLEADLAPTGAVDFDPCRECDVRCRRACPQKAFGKVVCTREVMGMDTLPGRSGRYSRTLCNDRMEADIAASGAGSEFGDGDGRRRVKYCRACEFACPVGKPGAP